MDVTIFNNPQQLAIVNHCLQFLRDKHDGKNPEQPDVDSKYMEAAMTIWVNNRKHVLYWIKLGFEELEKAQSGGRDTVAIKIALSQRIENYNGIFVPDMMASYDAATSSVPVEGWIIKTPPSQWRLIKKTEAPVKPVDRSGLFFISKLSWYTRIYRGLLKVNAYDALFGTAIQSVLFLAFQIYSNSSHAGYAKVVYLLLLFINLLSGLKYLHTIGDNKDAKKA